MVNLINEAIDRWPWLWVRIHNWGYRTGNAFPTIRDYAPMRKRLWAFNMGYWTGFDQC